VTDPRVDAYAEWVLAPSLPEQPARAERSYFICGIPRCGSWLLCGLLASVGVAGRPHEYFSPETEVPNRARWGTASFRDYLDAVLVAGTTDNGVFACKIMWSAMARLLERLEHERLALADVFPAPRFVWLVRDDVAAQAVSWARAMQTGHWHYWDRRSAAHEAKFDADVITALAGEIRRGNERWTEWFRAAGHSPLVVRYEDLVADTHAAARRVLEFLDIGLPSGVDPAEQTMSTADAVNEEWLDRYRSLTGQPPTSVTCPRSRGQTAESAWPPHG
jgi:trehalose 2-sulfotransferase